MARELKNFPNVHPPDASTDYGRIKDRVSGAEPGTPVNQETKDDIHQFFMRMADKAGINFNDLPESIQDGFQLYEALEKHIEGINAWANLPLATGWSAAGGDFYIPQFQVFGNWVRFRGVVKRDDEGASNQLLVNLTTPSIPEKSIRLLSASVNQLGSTGIVDSMQIIRTPDANRNQLFVNPGVGQDHFLLLDGLVYSKVV